MRRGGAVAMMLLVACAFALSIASSAWAVPRFDPSHADEQIAQARDEGLDAFCRDPKWPLSARAMTFCDEAQSIPRCEGLVKACGLGKKPPPDLSWLAWMARLLIYGLIAALVGLVVWLVVSAILRARRERAAAEAPPASKPAVPLDSPPLEEIVAAHDADALLRLAESHAARGELDRAAVLYLAASLRALDRRGAIRIARDRTNGEYVRACTDPEAKSALRTIAREADRVQYGGGKPTPEAIAEISSRAATLVRATAVVLTAIACLAGCNGAASKPGSDPAGDDLFFALLARQGANVTRLPTSLATLPIPKEDEPVPVLVVDVDRVPLEDDTRLHLQAWVEAGGLLVIAGSPGDWPTGLGAKPRSSDAREVKLAIPMIGDQERDDDEDEDDAVSAYDVHLGYGAGLTWKDAYELGASPEKVTWAARKVVGQGMVLGLASDDLMTNAGLANPPNAAALMALLAPWATHDIEVARVEDGISPPSNPLAALVRAGLGLALVHAALAGLVMAFAYGVRQARARPTPPPARRAWTEHLEATGGLYERARLAPHALEAYTKFVDGRVRARMPRGMSDPAAFLALRANADPSRCAALWTRATSTRSDDVARGDELAALRELSTLYVAAMKSE